ncbi:MAG: WD40 repeat domain-containing protein, partial [Cyanobacteria bacterium P01_D01_bin.56]
QTIKVWDLQRKVDSHTQIPHGGPVNSVAVTACGTLALSASSDGTFKLWDLENNTERLSLDSHSLGINSIAFMADDNYAIVACNDSTLKIWDLSDGTLQQTLLGHTDRVYALLVAASGEWAVSGSQDYTLRLWKLTNEAESIILAENIANAVKALAGTPDGDYAVWASGYSYVYPPKSYDYALHVWDLRNKAEKYTLKGHTSWVNTLAVTANNRWVISGSDDCTLKLWNLDDGRELKTLNGHTKSVRDVAITPDGKYAVSGSDDESLKVWNLNQESIIANFRGESAITACAISNKGTIVVAGEDSGRVHFLKLEDPD